MSHDRGMAKAGCARCGSSSRKDTNLRSDEEAVLLDTRYAALRFASCIETNPAPDLQAVLRPRRQSLARKEAARRSAECNTRQAPRQSKMPSSAKAWPDKETPSRSPSGARSSPPARARGDSAAHVANSSINVYWRRSAERAIMGGRNVIRIRQPSPPCAPPRPLATSKKPNRTACPRSHTEAATQDSKSRCPARNRERAPEAADARE